MKSIFATLSILLTVPVGHACAVSPIHQVSENPAKYFESFNTVFLGKVTDIVVSSSDLQIAKFEVLDLLKGGDHNNVKVINKLVTSCSTFFGGVGSNYYVFGNINSSGEIDLNGVPSFVPEQLAIEKEVLRKLPEN